MTVIRQVLALLTSEERRLVRRTLALGFATGVVQSAAIAALVPFIAIAMDPAGALDGGAGARVGELLGIDDARTLILVWGSLLLGLIVAGNTLAVLTHRRLQLTAWNVNHYLTRRLLGQVLHRPWPWFLQRHTSEIAQRLLEEVGVAVHSVLVPALVAVNRAIEGLLVVGLLLLLSPWITLGAGAIVGVAYLGTYLLLRRAQERLGAGRMDSARQRYHVTMETLAAVKEIRVMEAEDEFLRRLDATGPDYVRSRAWGTVLAQLPRHLLEVLAVGTVLLITLLLALDDVGLQPRLPTLGAMAFAGYKLVPAFHQIFASASVLRYAEPSVAALTTEFEEASAHDADLSPAEGGARVAERSFGLRDVQVRYPEAEEPVLADVDLEFRTGEWVGIVGTTGSGKSTLVDVLLGLLPPERGDLVVDGEPVRGTELRRWRRGIGFVPQRIYLADDTLAANIAFGESGADIDRERLDELARVVQLDDFIATLPDGWETRVGERGVRLSGGQAQRIGLARALYTRPWLLLLDEATSNLDPATEESVMEALRSYAGSRTVLKVAHRISTVRACDRILVVDRGRIAEEGSFDELLARSDLFRVLARGGVV